MSSKFNRISEVFLIALAVLPIVLFLDVIIAAIMEYSGVPLVWIIITIIFVILLIPLGAVLYFVILSFEEYDKVIITLKKKKQKTEKFEVDMKFGMKNLLRLIWINFKENRSQRVSWIKSLQLAFENLYENDLKPFLIEHVKIRYGLDSAEKMAGAKYYEIELEFL